MLNVFYLGIITIALGLIDYTLTYDLDLIISGTAIILINSYNEFAKTVKGEGE